MFDHFNVIALLDFAVHWLGRNPFSYIEETHQDPILMPDDLLVLGSSSELLGPTNRLSELLCDSKPSLGIYSKFSKSSLLF